MKVVDEKSISVLRPIEKEKLLKDIHHDWKLTHEQSRLVRNFKFKDMSAAMQAANEIAVLADELWHHPELNVGFGHLGVEIWTHTIKNLAEGDFIFAAKVDKIMSHLGE